MGRWLLVACLAGCGVGLAVADSEFNADRARVNYMLSCQGCHLAAGQGAHGAVPRMSNYVGNFLRVPGGREFLVQVPGSANAAIDDAELAELLNWILMTMSPNELPDPWRRYSAEEVGGLRATPLREVEALRARLVDRIEASTAP
jgi:hypothetical protein